MYIFLEVDSVNMIYLVQYLEDTIWSYFLYTSTWTHDTYVKLVSLLIKLAVDYYNKMKENHIPSSARNLALNSYKIRKKKKFAITKRAWMNVFVSCVNCAVIGRRHSQLGRLKPGPHFSGPKSSWRGDCSHFHHWPKIINKLDFKETQLSDSGHMVCSNPLKIKEKGKDFTVN